MLQYRGFAPHAAAYARKSPFGTLLFLSNFNNTPLQTTPRDGVPLTINPNAVIPVVLNYPINKFLTIRRLYGRTLGFVRQGRFTTLVMFGPAGSQGMLQVHTALPLSGKVPAGFQKLPGKPNTLSLSVKYAAGPPRIFTLKTGKQTLRVLAENLCGTPHLVYKLRSYAMGGLRAAICRCNWSLARWFYHANTGSARQRYTIRPGFWPFTYADTIRRRCGGQRYNPLFRRRNAVLAVLADAYGHGTGAGEL